jgi:hypothetical protein
MTREVSDMAGKRTNPTFLGELEGERPQRTRTGYWKEMLETTFKPNPGKTFTFGDVSGSTASNLRRDYGLDATTSTVKNADGTEVIKMYVSYDPDRVEAIKADVRERGEKRKASVAANREKAAAKEAAANGGKGQGSQAKVAASTR